MAMNSFQLFLNQVQNAPEDLKVKVLRVVFDILMVYDDELLLRSEDIVSWSLSGARTMSDHGSGRRRRSSLFSCRPSKSMNHQWCSRSSA